METQEGGTLVCTKRITKHEKKSSWKELFCKPLDHEMNTPSFNPRDEIKSTIRLEMAWELVHSLWGT